MISVTLTDGADGSVHPLYQDVFIPGVLLDGGARVAFGARTGGAADFHELDNIQVAFVPEPSSFVLAGLGLAGMVAAVRRRRSA